MSSSSENAPTNEDLWERVQRLVSGDTKYIDYKGKRYYGPKEGQGYTKHPSAYSNGWALSLYKKLGGKWRKACAESIALRIANLADWFGKEDWVAIDTTGNVVGPCAQSEKRPKETSEGQDPIKCLPRSKAQAMSKKERASAARRKKRLEKSSPDSKTPVHAPTAR